MPHCPNPNCNQKYTAKKGTNFCKRCGTKLETTASDDNDGHDASAATRSRSPSSHMCIVVFGAGGVGKSSIILRFTSGAFVDEVIPFENREKRI
jgi:putative ribosome biogenesis GTPase RsgA